MTKSDKTTRGWPPELERFPSNEEAKEAVRVWSKQQMKTVSFWFGLIGYTALIGLVVAGLLMLSRRWIMLSAGVFGGIVGGVTGGTGTLFMRWYWRHQYQRFLRTRLIAIGIPICLKCGYDLTGNESGVCPECGAPHDETDL